MKICLVYKHVVDASGCGPDHLAKQRALGFARMVKVTSGHLSVQSRSGSATGWGDCGWESDWLQCLNPRTKEKKASVRVGSRSEGRHGWWKAQSTAVIRGPMARHSVRCAVSDRGVHKKGHNGFGSSKNCGCRRHEFPSEMSVWRTASENARCRPGCAQAMLPCDNDAA